MERLIEQQAVIDCLTNIAKYYEREDADEWTKGIHYGLLHGLDNILDNAPTVEAIPKDQYDELKANITMMRLDYEASLKADLEAILTELLLEIEEMDSGCGWEGYRPTAQVIGLIQQKINALKGEV